MEIIRDRGKAEVLAGDTAYAGLHGQYIFPVKASNSQTFRSTDQILGTSHFASFST